MTATSTFSLAPRERFKSAGIQTALATIGGVVGSYLGGVVGTLFWFDFPGLGPVPSYLYDMPGYDILLGGIVGVWAGLTLGGCSIGRAIVMSTAIIVVLWLLVFLCLWAAEGNRLFERSPKSPTSPHRFENINTSTLPVNTLGSLSKVD